MTAGSMSRRGLQESALEICRSFRPILRRCASFAHPNERHHQPPKAVRMAIQQAENLKWQQDMYVRLLKMMGLVQEGLIKQEDLSAFRQRLLDNLTASHTAGEWAEFTRDKLLFLQELFYAKCISEAEYHVAKKPLLLRLAEQGAEIDSNDIILYSSAEPSSPSTSEAKSFHRTVQVISNRKKNNTKPAVEEAVPKKSPVKHVFEAMSRFKVHPSKANNEEKTQIRVPHALDFLRPTDCPIRDPPNPPHPDPFPHDNSPSPLFYSPGGSISSVESSSKAPSRMAPVLGFTKDEASPVSLFATPKKADNVIASVNPAARNLFPSPPDTKKSPLSEVSNNKGGSGPRVATLLSDLMRKLQGETVKQMNYDDILSDDEEEEVTSPRVKSRLDFIKPPPRRFPIQEDAKADENETPLSPSKVPKPTPDTVKLKKNIHAKGSGTDFFIDKVLGENIKKELDRIRLEMSRTNPTQMFTNDQIDAISTRLPADKAELMRFFPKQWCDRYGDIVLDVVHKEFKGHISDMEVARKAARERRKVPKQQENDENSENGVTNTKKTGATVKAVNFNRCFTTMDVNVAYVPLSQENQLKTPRKLSSLNREAEYERELDGKLHAEILKMPHRRTPDTLPLRV